MNTDSAIITCGTTRLLNVPHAWPVIQEVWEEDCYRLSQIPDGAIVMDVGAFYGEFGLLCAVEKSCEVFAFEPLHDNYLVAKANNAINPAVYPTVLKVAIGGKSGPRPLLTRAGHPAGTSLYASEGYRVAETVACETLSQQVDFAVRRHGLAAPICVKLDCEGAEREIFEEDQDWLDKVQIVTMEWHNFDGDFYRDMLLSRGFKVEIEGSGPKPRPKYDKSMAGGLLFARKEK